MKENEMNRMKVYFVKNHDHDKLKKMKKTKIKSDYGEHLYNPDKEMLWVGVGENPNTLTPYKVKLLGGVIGQISKKYNKNTIMVQFPGWLKKSLRPMWARELEFGIRTYSYKYTLKTEKDETFDSMKVKIFFSNDYNTDAKLLAETVNKVRELVDMPSNMKTPDRFAQFVKGLFKGTKVKVTVLDDKQLKRLGMNGVLAVGKGSSHPPRVVIAEYGKEYKKNGTYAFVGKGITFDSGGISLKPSEKMDEMKRDMAGAAAVFGALRALAKTGVKKHLVAVGGVAENMPGGNAQRPGDVIRMFNGKTVEVKNTDAEGRLVLSDVLAYTEKRFKPNYIVDLATLTGAVIIALGHRCAGVMGNDKRLTDKILRAGERSGDRCWELPLWDEYDENIESDIADYSNIGHPRGAGSIVGATLLKHFVSVPWAHVDIAGTAWYDMKKPFAFSGATGFGVRLLYELVKTDKDKKS